MFLIIIDILRINVRPNLSDLVEGLTLAIEHHLTLLGFVQRFIIVERQ